MFPRLIGVPVKLGRFEALLGDMGVREGKERGRVKKGCMPSLCDLGVWRFENVERVVGDGEVRGLLERTYAGREKIV